MFEISSRRLKKLIQIPLTVVSIEFYIREFFRIVIIIESIYKTLGIAITIFLYLEHAFV